MVVPLSGFKIYIFADMSQGFALGAPSIETTIRFADISWDIIAGDINLAEYADPSEPPGLISGFSESTLCRRVSSLVSVYLSFFLFPRRLFI
jgi:hypothetical protein